MPKEYKKGPSKKRERSLWGKDNANTSKTAKEESLGPELQWEKDWVQPSKPAQPDLERKTKHSGSSASGELLYADYGVSSAVAMDVEALELEVSPIKGHVTGSLIHGEAKSSFNLGRWFKSLFEDNVAQKTFVFSAPMAARLSDRTAVGLGLSPGSASPDVLIGYLPAWRAEVDTHVTPGRGTGAVVSGCGTVLINQRQACRVSDLVLEAPGGPNAIVDGCASVEIGTLARKRFTLRGVEPSDPNPLALSSGGSIDIGTVEGEAELSAQLSSEEQSVSAKLGGVVAGVKGEVGGELCLPFFGHSISLGLEAEVTALSAGLEVQASAGRRNGVFETRGGAGAHAGVLGLSVEFSLKFK